MSAPFFVALLLTILLAATAPALGWIDRREGAEERKPRTSPVPLVGGAAMLGGFAAAASLGGTVPAWVPLVAAFLLGLVDDVLPGGLSASKKLAGQGIVGLLVVLLPGEAFADAGALERVLLGVLAVVAMNAVNTFDHQDGLAGTLGALALLSSAPRRAAAVAGYLVPNTVLRRRTGPHESVPVAMMGDSGSHLLGVAIATTPGAAPLLFVPLLDLARVARARIVRGQPFWVGDRTHLGHRLAALGFGPVAVALLVAAILAPPVVTGAVGSGALPVAVGLTLSGFLYAIALRATEDVAAGLLPPAASTEAEGAISEEASGTISDDTAPEPDPPAPSVMPEEDKKPDSAEGSADAAPSRDAALSRDDDEPPREPPRESLPKGWDVGAPETPVRASRHPLTGAPSDEGGRGRQGDGSGTSADSQPPS